MIGTNSTQFPAEDKCRKQNQKKENRGTTDQRRKESRTKGCSNIPIGCSEEKVDETSPGKEIKKKL